MVPLLLLALALQDPSVDLSHGDLKVSENKRFLVHADGTPFFWLGDTAWELFHRLTREEAERYLENRRAKRFTVIQAVALAELDGLQTPDAAGHRPLLENDPTRPANEYWDHVDWIVKKAEEKGIFIGLLHTWGTRSRRCGAPAPRSSRRRTPARTGGGSERGTSPLRTLSGSTAATVRPTSRR